MFLEIWTICKFEFLLVLWEEVLSRRYRNKPCEAPHKFYRIHIQNIVPNIKHIIHNTEIISLTLERDERWNAYALIPSVLFVCLSERDKEREGIQNWIGI